MSWVISTLDEDTLCSPFQALTVSLLSAPLTLVGCHNLMQIFTAAMLPHHCRSNLTVEYPRLPDDPCTQYMSTMSNDTKPCDQGWEFDQTIRTSTINSEWNLVCDREALKEVALSVYMAGVLVGATVYGILADRFGRRTIILCCLLQIATMGVGVGLSPNFYLYCLFRFLSGMGICGLVINDLGLTMEWVPKRYRPMASMLQGYCLTCGAMILVGVAYFIRDWRWLQITLSIPYFIFFMFVCWVPESARWLSLNKHSKKALANLNRAAKFNGKKDGIPVTLEMLKQDNKKMSTKSTSPNPMDLFRTPAMRTITLVLSLSWFTTSFCYFPIAMDVQRFGLSMYLTQVVFAASEFPMRLLSTIGAFYIGRRVTIAFLLILSGTLLLCTMAIPTDMTVLQMILTAVAKSIIGSCIVCSYLYTTELYPTVLRQTGMGFTNMMMRLGAVVAPIVMITKAYVSFLPLVIFGVMPIISGLPILWLPETKDCALLDTVEEVETRAWKLKTPAITQNNNIVHGTKV